MVRVEPGDLGDLGVEASAGLATHHGAGEVDPDVLAPSVHGDEAVNEHVVAGFFADLPRNRIDRGLAHIEFSAGEPPGLEAVGLADQEHPAVVVCDPCEGAHIGIELQGVEPRYRRDRLMCGADVGIQIDLDDLAGQRTGMHDGHAGEPLSDQHLHMALVIDDGVAKVAAQLMCQIRVRDDEQQGTIHVPLSSPHVRGHAGEWTRACVEPGPAVRSLDPMSTSDAPVVIVSEKARAEILAMRAQEVEGDSLALSVAVTGRSGNEYTYELTFEPMDELPVGAVVGRSGDLPVAVASEDEEKLRGAVLDLVEPTGLVLRNPNRPPPLVVPGSLVLTGTVEERLTQLLDGEINPMLAAHGGYAAMDRVEGEVAYLSMGGGCQGCGLAQMTLTEGIRTSILEQIPEITSVVDVTDHRAGTNPFYDPA